jgi:hypothetical protein
MHGEEHTLHRVKKQKLVGQEKNNKNWKNVD